MLAIERLRKELGIGISESIAVLPFESGYDNVDNQYALFSVACFLIL